MNFTLIFCVAIVCLTAIVITGLALFWAYASKNGVKSWKESRFKAVMSNYAACTLGFKSYGKGLTEATNVKVETCDNPITNKVLVKVTGEFDRSDLVDMMGPNREPWEA